MSHQYIFIYLSPQCQHVSPVCLQSMCCMDSGYISIPCFSTSWCRSALLWDTMKRRNKCRRCKSVNARQSNLSDLLDTEENKHQQSSALTDSCTADGRCMLGLTELDLWTMFVLQCFNGFIWYGCLCGTTFPNLCFWWGKSRLLVCHSALWLCTAAVCSLCTLAAF